MRPTRGRDASLVGALAALLAVVPAAARGETPSHCTCICGLPPAGEGAARHAESADGGGPVGSVELGVGLKDVAQVLDRSGPAPAVGDVEAGTTTTLTPVIEWPLSRFIFLGAGLRMLQSAEASTGAQVRLRVLNPVGRLRLLFPIAGRFSADAAFDGGVALWSSGGESSLVGWSEYAGLGPSARVTTSLAAFLHVGYFSASARSISDSSLGGSAPVAGPQILTLTSLQIVLGVRNQL